MRMLMLPLCLIAGLFVGELIKGNINSTEYWQDYTCEELAEIPESGYPQEAKDKALEVFNNKCVTK
ncbi:hypothetical protein VPT02_026 [Vibrio phage VPT02]|nr:hypothetical protein VPT02_026 [Vibrio phage VPT02]